MAKLQKITRKNFSEVYSINLPKEIIEELNWKKGDELEFLINIERLIITKISMEIPEKTMENGENGQNN